MSTLVNILLILISSISKRYFVTVSIILFPHKFYAVHKSFILLPSKRELRILYLHHKHKRSDNKYNLNSHNDVVRSSAKDASQINNNHVVQLHRNRAYNDAVYIEHYYLKYIRIKIHKGGIY